MSELLNPRTLRDRNVVNVDIGNNQHVVARKEDMTVLIFDGRVPMPLLVAVQKMIDMADASPTERLAALGAEHAAALVDVVRAHALEVVLRPKIVLEDDGNPDHLPIALLDLTQLIKIWSATAVVPMVTAAQAAEFRASGSADDGDAARNGQDVSTAAQPVVVRDIESFVGH